MSGTDEALGNIAGIDEVIEDERHEPRTQWRNVHLILLVVMMMLMTAQYRHQNSIASKNILFSATILQK